jgi:hypothetical protein
MMVSEKKTVGSADPQAAGRVVEQGKDVLRWPLLPGV